MRLCLYRAALGDFKRVRNGFGNVSEQFPHFFSCFEILGCIDTLAIFLAQILAIRNTHHCVVCLGVRRLHEPGIMRRYQRQAQFIGEVNQPLFASILIFGTMTRDLYIAALRIS